MACFEGIRQQCASVSALVASRISHLPIMLVKACCCCTLEAAVALGRLQCDTVCNELGRPTHCQGNYPFLFPKLSPSGLVRLITDVMSLPAQPDTSVATNCVQPSPAEQIFKVRRSPANKRSSTYYVSRCCLQSHAAYSPMPAPLGCQAADWAWRFVASAALVVTGGARRACH